MAIRYIAPNADINKINISINGTMAVRNLNFPKTDDNQWATVELDVNLQAGNSPVIISTTATHTEPLYLDNFILTPKFDASADTLKEDTSACDNRIFNLFGMPVDPDKMQKGQIYIQNGKKIINNQP